MHPKKVILPAVFIFVLGAGNIFVGSFKEWQYRQVYEELTILESSPDFALNSGLNRLQNMKDPSDHYLQGQREAKDRLQFYRLVAFGGKVFIGLSILLLVTALLRPYLTLPASTSSAVKLAGSMQSFR